MGTGGPPPYSAAAAARLKRPLPMPEAMPDDKSRIKEEPAPSAPKRMNMGPAAAAGPKQSGQPVIKTEAEEVAVKSEGPSVASGQSSVRYHTNVMYTVLDNF